MELFHILDYVFVILRHRGVYRQAKVYARGSSLFGAWGGGFVQLRGAGATTKPDVTWESMTEIPQIVEHAGRFGEPLFLQTAEERLAIAKRKK